MKNTIKLIPQVKPQVTCFPEQKVTVGLSSKFKDDFGTEITFSEVMYELAKRNMIFTDSSMREKILSFKDARMDKLGNMYLFNQ